MRVARNATTLNASSHPAIYLLSPIDSLLRKLALCSISLFGGDKLHSNHAVGVLIDEQKTASGEQPINVLCDTGSAQLKQ